MMAEQKELHTESQEMQSSLEIVQGEVRLWKAQYEGAKEELQSMEISLKKLRSQCEVRPGLVAQDRRHVPWATALDQPCCNGSSLASVLKDHV